ncbi:MAG: YaiI/YqxD family protein [Desulfuromonadales bacterium]|nr:YaiI/YqxD family protein [Desulfuromonadales bacterium]
MQIWVDADACPRVVKEMLFRAAERVSVVVTLVANQPLRTPPSQFIKTLVVGAGFDVADDRIVAEVAAGDLVVTADIPLAAAAIKRGALVLDFRGEMLTEDNIQERLTIRNMLDELRGVGVETGGPAAFSSGDKHAFARQLDTLLARKMAST